METTLFVETASKAGVLGPAMVDTLARAEAHFAAKEVTAESVQQFLTELRDTAPHLFAPSHQAQGPRQGLCRPTG